MGSLASRKAWRGSRRAAWQGRQRSSCGTQLMLVPRLVSGWWWSDSGAPVTNMSSRRPKVGSDSPDVSVVPRSRPDDVNVHTGLFHFIRNYLGQSQFRRFRASMETPASRRDRRPRRQRLRLGEIRFPSSVPASVPYGPLQMKYALPDAARISSPKPAPSRRPGSRCRRERQSRLWIIERWIQPVRSQHRLVTELGQALDAHTRLLRQQWNEIDAAAPKYRPHRSATPRLRSPHTGNDAPFHAIDLRQPAAARPVLHGLGTRGQRQWVR